MRRLQAAIALLALAASGGAFAREPEHDIHFDRAEVCALCHASSPNASAMRDAKGRSVAPYELWRGTMMANSARDPVWQAVVSAEVAATPSRKADIEAKCLRCHAPMASAQAGFEDRRLGFEVLKDEGPFGLLARDGVSCTICHQVGPEKLGEEASFTGGYRVGHDQVLYGPHASPFAMPMVMHSNFTPVKGDHVLRSELCATCHTLATSTLEPDGSATGERFLEQAPYLEWRNSDYRDGGERAATCQSCHLPTTDADGDPIRTAIARNPGGFDFPPVGAREPFGRHLLVGGNVLVPALLRDHSEELGVEAPRGAFDGVLAAAREQLEQRTARLELRGLALVEGRLKGGLVVENLTGHAFPTGHPARRAWLRVRVLDAEGRVLFVSGEHDERGRLVDSSGRVLPSEQPGGPGLPHLSRLDATGQVQSYESLMADTHGGLTSQLLRAATWRKNNRLLPHGWKADHPDAAASRPAGVEGDEDFAGGFDRLALDLPVGPTKGPVRVEAELLYQPLSARYLAELLQHDTPEVRRLERLLKTADLTPAVAGRAEATVAGG